MTAPEKAVQATNPYDQAMNLALKFLGPRARSTSEVRGRLEQSGVPEATIEEVLRRLKDLQLLNDSELALDLAERARARGDSSRRIRADLKTRNLPEEPVTAGWLPGAEPDAEEERALKLARSRVRALKNLHPQAARRRLAGYLTRRGYDFEVVENVCLAVLPDGGPGGSSRPEV